jgi:hypothetical protein
VKVSENERVSESDAESSLNASRESASQVRMRDRLLAAEGEEDAATEPQRSSAEGTHSRTVHQKYDRDRCCAQMHEQSRLAEGGRSTTAAEVSDSV